jgi:hypothetical protein
MLKGQRMTAADDAALSLVLKAMLAQVTKIAKTDAMRKKSGSTFPSRENN